MARSDLPDRIAAYRHAHPRLFHDRNRLRVGLLGGSFNPAHKGHIHVSLKAHKQLSLDQIWWIVSPQNPLKSTTGMAPLVERLAYAQKIAAPHPFLRVVAPEADLPKNYTFTTLKYLIKTMPLSRLVWIMGADNLDQFSQWYRYRDVIRLLPIAVIGRPSYSLRAIATSHWLLGRRFSVSKMRCAIAKRTVKLPSWCFLPGQIHAASATKIRQQARSAHVNESTGAKN